MSGTVVWITGLPGSGKTTLALEIARRLQENGRHPVILDGDEVRGALVPTPGYSPPERDQFYETLGRLVLLVSAQGHLVLVPATAPRRAHRDPVRAQAARFVEVYVRTPIEVCAARDTKGLYARARAGLAPDLPGAGVDYEPPEAPDVVAEDGQDSDAAAAVVAWLR